MRNDGAMVPLSKMLRICCIKQCDTHKLEAGGEQSLWHACVHMYI